MEPLCQRWRFSSFEVTGVRVWGPGFTGLYGLGFLRGFGGLRVWGVRWSQGSLGFWGRVQGLLIRVRGLGFKFFMVLGVCGVRFGSSGVRACGLSGVVFRLSAGLEFGY